MVFGASTRKKRQAEKVPPKRKTHEKVRRYMRSENKLKKMKREGAVMLEGYHRSVKGGEVHGTGRGILQ